MTKWLGHSFFPCGLAGTVDDQGGIRVRGRALLSCKVAFSGGKDPIVLFLK
jgi:hypothetical protein